MKIRGITTPISLVLWNAILLCSCNRVVSEDTPNRVDQLAGYDDVRLGMKLGEVTGLVRDPIHDRLRQHEEAYSRPAQYLNNEVGKTAVMAKRITYYSKNDRIQSIKLSIEDNENVRPIADGQYCRQIRNGLFEYLGEPTWRGGISNSDYLWKGQRTEIVFGIIAIAGTVGCFYHTSMLEGKSSR